MYPFLLLFHDWFPLVFVFTYNISLMRSEINSNQKKIKRALHFDQLMEPEWMDQKMGPEILAQISTKLSVCPPTMIL